MELQLLNNLRLLLLDRFILSPLDFGFRHAALPALDQAARNENNRARTIASPANRKLEGIVVQRFATARFNDDGGAELESRLEIHGYWIGLNDVDHVFFQRPALERVGRRFGPQLGRFAGFAVKNAVVGSKAAFLDHRSRRDDLLAGRSRLTNHPNVFVTLIGGVEKLSVSRGGLFAHGERAVDLSGVAPVTHRQLGNDDAAFFENA